MSFFLGGSKGGASKPEYTGLQLQTSSSVQALIVAWGANRFAPNLIWYNDFATHKVKQKAGKGGAGASTSYTYSASVIMALCEGAIDDVRTVYRDSDTNTTYSALGMTLFKGTNPQDPWGYVTTKHPTEARGYAGVAYLAVANYDLGSSAALPNHSFEVLGRAFSTSRDGDDDADPAIVIDEFLTYPAFSVGMDRSVIDLTTLYATTGTTTGDATVQTYCAVQGYGLSPILSDQSAASDTLQNWCDALNIAIVWTGYSLKFIPYDLVPASANGFFYTPQNTALATLTDRDFVSTATDPVIGTRSDPADAYNDLVLTINDRTNSYNETPVEWKDQGLIDQYGLRPGSSVTADFITRTAMATKCVAIMGQRMAYQRNTYKVTLGPGAIIYEPMDLLNLFDKKIGVIFVQVTDIEEQDDSSLEFTFEEISISISSNADGFTPAAYAAGGQDSGLPPGPVNPPIIFDVPANLTNGSPEVWAVVSGGDGTNAGPYWGGCTVYISTDNATFQAIGEVDSPCRQGKTTSAITNAGGSPDNANTLGVDLSMSNGDLISVSADDATNGQTLCYVGGELISFETATLTAVDKYNLTHLFRGQYQTAPAAHAVGVPFARLDDNVFRYPLPAAYIGKTLYFKFQSINIWNKAPEDLSTVTTYTYTPSGLGFAIGAPASCALTFAAVTQTDGTSIITGTITAGASAGPYLDHYDAQYSPDNGATWIDAPSINASGTTTVFKPALATTSYKARVRAVSSATGGTPSAWVTTATVNSGDLVSTVPDAPTGLAATAATLANNLTWTPALTGSMETAYHIYAQNVGTGGVFTSAHLVGSSLTPNWTHSGLGVSDPWTYWVVASNAKGDSVPAGPVEQTTSASGGGGGGGSVEVDNPSGTSVVAVATKLSFNNQFKITVGSSGEAIIALGADDPAWKVDAVGTGASQTVVLPEVPPSRQAIFVFVNGLRLYTSEYTISGASVTLTTNSVNDPIEVIGMIGTIGGVAPWHVNATGTGVAGQVIAIPNTVTGSAAIMIFVNGLRMPTSEYSIAGTNVTLTNGTNSNGDPIEIVGSIGSSAASGGGGGGGSSNALMIQSAYGRGNGSATATYANPTTAGNLLIAVGCGFNSAKGITAGWTLVGSFSDVSNQGVNLWIKFADGTETAVVSSGSDNQQIAAYEFSGVASIAVQSHSGVVPDGTNKFGLLFIGDDGYLLCCGCHDDAVAFTGDTNTSGLFVEQHLSPGPADGANHCGWFGVYKPTALALRNTIGCGDSQTVQTMVVAVT